MVCSAQKQNSTLAFLPSPTVSQRGEGHRTRLTLGLPASSCLGRGSLQVTQSLLERSHEAQLAAELHYLVLKKQMS